MQTQFTPCHIPNIPVIDKDFDRFEITMDLRADLYEAKAVIFHHHASDWE